MSFRDDPDARRYLPHRGHWTHDTVVDRKRRLYAVWALAGQTASLMDADDIEANRAADDKLRQSVSAPEVELWTHFVRVPGLRMRDLPPVPTFAGARLDAAYRSRPAHDRLHDQYTFVTAVMRPRLSLETVGRALFDPPRLAVDVPASATQDFDALCHKVQDSLGRYVPARLGLRPGRDGVWFSDVFGAWHAVANCRLGNVPVSAESMGRLIVPHRPEFGDARSPEGAFLGTGGPRLFAVLTFLRYPARVSPLMFDDLRELRDCGVVVTNAEGFVLRQKAADRLDVKMNTKESAQGRAAAKQLRQMQDEHENIESGDAVPVTHHFSVAVHAHSTRDLDRAVGRAQRVMGEQGVVLHRQDAAIKPTFYGQIPGNLHHSCASAPTTSEHTAAFATPNSVSRGHDASRWGAPVLVLRTESDTEYPLHLHIPGGFDAEKGGYEESDRGNIRIQGPPGTGKTALLGAITNGVLRVPNSRVFCVDNRLGMSVAIEAQGGSYAEAIPGKPFLNLLAGVPDTEEGLNQAHHIVCGALATDGHGGLEPVEDERLTRGIARQLRLPRRKRSLWGVLAMLPKRPVSATRPAAAARLRRWCRGEKDGWALDAALDAAGRDALDLSARVSGFDTTRLKKHRAAGPVIAAVLQRVAATADGNPFVLIIDEAWQIDLNPELQEPVEHALATGRKDEWVVVLAAQKPETYSKGGSADAYRNQIPTSIWFADPGADREALARDHHLTPAEIEIVTEWLVNNPRCFLLKRPTESLICRFDLSGAAGAIAVLSARRSTYKLMRALQARYGRAPEVWLPHFERLAPAVAAAPDAGDDDPDKWDDDDGQTPVALLEAAE